MKKTLILLFTVLVLVCVVACSSIPKASGIRIFAEKGYHNLEETVFELKFGKLESVEDLNNPDLMDNDYIITGVQLAEGPVTLLLDPGVYYYQIHINGSVSARGQLVVKAPSKDVNYTHFVVSEGDIIDYELICWD